MKTILKFLLLVLVVLTTNTSAFAQTIGVTTNTKGNTTLSVKTTDSKVVKPKVANTIIDATGNFKEKSDVKLDKTYTSSEGKVFDVYQNAKGKYYIITGISEKTGKPKKKYLVI